MNQTENKRAILLPFVVFITISLVFLGIWVSSRQQQKNVRENRTAQIAEQVAIRLETYFETRFDIVGMMKVEWEQGRLHQKDEFRKRALYIQKQFEGLLAINWIDPEGVIRWVVPEEENHSALNRDLKRHPGGASKTFMLAYESSQFQVTPPIDLLQGGRGIAGYFPLSLQGKQDGYLNAVFRLKPLVENCLSRGVLKNYAFVLHDGAHKVYQNGTDDALAGNIMQSAQMLTVGNRQWSLQLMPMPATLARYQTNMHHYFLALGFVLAFGLAYLTRRLILREQALSESEHKFRALADSTSAAIFISYDDHYIYANPAAIRHTGYSFEELCKMNPEQILHPDSMAYIMRLRERARRLNEAIPSRLELRVVTADESERTVEVTYGSFELGGVPAVITTSFDVTERKQAEQKLREEEHKYRTIFETSGSAMVSLDKDAIILLANKEFEKLSGYTRKEIEGTNLWSKLLDAESLQKLEKLRKLDDLDEKLTTHSQEMVLINRNGKTIDCLSLINVVPGTDQWVMSFVDISERKQAELQMLRAEKMAALGQIIAGVAHEINNPNNFIYFNLPILKRYVDAIRPILDREAEEVEHLRILNMSYHAFLEDLYKLIENMQDGSERITGIVSELKNYIRSHEAQEKKPEPIAAMVDRVMILVGKQVRKMVKHMEIELDPDLPKVLVHSGKIEQVLINLIINAGQAANKADSRVRVSANRHPQNRKIVQLRIQDNGSGIDKELREKIFDPFFTTKSRDSGTGLGLAISQRIIEEHDGRLFLDETEAETTFIIELPMAESEYA